MTAENASKVATAIDHQRKSSKEVQQKEDNEEHELYNFDGQYGKEYRSFIRTMIPGYDTALEIASDVLVAKFASTESNKALEAMAIGPGYGEELVTIAKALPPQAKITAYEPSKAMVQACRHRISSVAGLSERVAIHNEEFGGNKENATNQYFDVVTIFNVLHLMPETQQRILLRKAAELVRPGGILLISGATFAPDYDSSLLRQIAERRWERMGICEEKRVAIHGSIGHTLFSALLPAQMEEELGNFSQPKEFFRGLGNFMCYIEKKSEK